MPYMQEDKEMTELTNELIQRLWEAENLLLKARLMAGYINKYDPECMFAKDGSALGFVQDCFDHLNKYEEASEYSEEEK